MLKIRAQDIRFLAFMAVFTGLVFSVYREEVLGPPLEPFALLTAKMTLALLNGLGIEAVLAGTVISHPAGFAYEIAYTCVGFLPVVFAAAAVLSYPVSLTHRLVGVSIGIPLLLGLNLTRLVHLFHLGVQDRATFDWWHEDLWPGIIRLTIVALWIVWAWWAERRSKRLATSPTPLPSPLPPGERVEEAAFQCEEGVAAPALPMSALRISSMARESRWQ